MKKKSKINYVKIKGREGYKDFKGRIIKSTWTIRGKKRKIIVVFDNKNRKLSRSTKIKSIKEAKDIFEKRGSLSNRYTVEYKTNVKEVSVPFKRISDIKKQPKTRSGTYQVFTTAFLPNGKRIDATSDKHNNNYKIEDAIKESNERLRKRVDQAITGGYDAENGKKFIKSREVAVKIGIKYYTKR